MHDHIVCEHELKYCRVCDIAYCEKCKKEWRYYNVTFTQPYITYGDGTAQWVASNEITNHVHGKDLE